MHIKTQNVLALWTVFMQNINHLKTYISLPIEAAHYEKETDYYL